MVFYLGTHLPHKADRFERAFISYNRLRGRVSDFPAPEDWVLDSGAFSQIQTHGGFLDTPKEYAEGIKRWSKCGNMVAAVSQDFMCEPEQIEKTGASVEKHQFWTVVRYAKIKSHLRGSGVYLMPVLQGWDSSDYLEHLEMYGSRLEENAWVGVGSVCKRNSHPSDIVWILSKIKEERPDLRLHGFGVKAEALQNPRIVDLLYSADSMAWSYWGRRVEGEDANDWRTALKWKDKVLNKRTTEAPLFD